MYRADNSTNAAALPATTAPGPNPDGFFTDGNPSGGTPATIVDAEWLNMVQEELAGTIEASGITLDKTKTTQLAAAISALANAAKVYDIAFVAGFDGNMVAKDLGVQTYSELVVPRAGSFVGEAGYIDTAGTVADVIVDVLKNGVSIYATKPKFPTGTNTLTAGVLKNDGTENFGSGDRITFKVTQIGSTIAGSGLRFTIKGVFS